MRFRDLASAGCPAVTFQQDLEHEQAHEQLVGDELARIFTDSSLW